jgi:hypothetical protein
MANNSGHNTAQQVGVKYYITHTLAWKCKCKGKVKFHPRIGYEGPEGE